MIYKGTIKGFSGSWRSGLGFLSIEREDGLVLHVPCENAQTVRALDACFGGVIGPGHTVDNNPRMLRGEDGRFIGKTAGHIDQEIYWSYDEFGMCLGGFTPVDQASDELIEAYLEDKEND